MTETLAAYAASLDRQLVCLDALHGLARELRGAADAGAWSAIADIGARRAELIEALTALNRDAAPLREWIVANAPDARRVPLFATIISLHRVAERLIGTVLVDDEATIAALQDGDRDRRVTTRLLEAGEATLAAYRRTISAPSHAELVSRLG